MNEKKAHDCRERAQLAAERVSEHEFYLAKTSAEVRELKRQYAEAESRLERSKFTDAHARADVARLEEELDSSRADEAIIVSFIRAADAIRSVNLKWAEFYDGKCSDVSEGHDVPDLPCPQETDLSNASK